MTDAFTGSVRARERRRRARECAFHRSAVGPFPATPEPLAKVQAVETGNWGGIIKAVGIQPE